MWIRKIRKRENHREREIQVRKMREEVKYKARCGLGR